MNHFLRLLDILHPYGGVMIVAEGYFDESGDLRDPPGIFCVSGYFLSSPNAKAMDQEWRKVLSDHEIPYFHMVDCAHEPPAGFFAGKGKEERILIVTKLIDLIKQYTIEGFTIFARADAYAAMKGAPDVYSECAAAAVDALRMLIDTHQAIGNIAYFFESGHPSKASALQFIAQNAQRPGDSVTFACKAEVPLLQAADLLAWQSAKYAKDYFYPHKIDGADFKRLPRKDFQSLMQHPHIFYHMNRGIDGRADAGAMSIELWPMHRRWMRPSGVKLSVDESGPISFLREEGDETPLFPVNQTLDWNTGTHESVYISVEGFKGQKYRLQMDELRLFKMLVTLIEATAPFEHSQYVPAFQVENVDLTEKEGPMLLRVKLHAGATLAFLLSPELVAAIKDRLGKGDR